MENSYEHVLPQSSADISETKVDACLEGGLVEWEEARRIAVARMIAEPSMRNRYLDKAGFERESEETRRKFDVFLQESFKERNSELFSDLENFLGEASSGKVVELLTLIRLYGDSYRPDLCKEELFRHSLGVFRIIAEAYGDISMMSGGGASASFRLDGSIAEEMGKKKDSEGDCEDARREMLLAALIHDVGKITLPEEIVYNSVSNTESLDAICDAMKDCSDVSLYVARILKRCRDQWRDFPALSKDFLDEELPSNREDASWRFIQIGDEIRVSLSEKWRADIQSWFSRKRSSESGGREVRINPLMSVGMLLEIEVKKEAKNSKDIFNKELGENFVREETLKRIGRLAIMNPLIDPGASLEEVLRLHEERSGLIVRVLESAAIRESLVAHHHNYNCEFFHVFSPSQTGGSYVQMMKFFQSHGILSNLNEPLVGTVANRLMSLGDVSDALESKRSYKELLPFGRELEFFVDLARAERLQYERNLQYRKDRGEPIRERQERHARQGLGVITRFIEHKIRMHERDTGIRWEDDMTIDARSRQVVNDFLEEERKRIVDILGVPERKL